MILPVLVEEIDAIPSTLGDSFYKECDLPGGFIPEVFIHNWKMIMNNKMGAMWKLVIDEKPVGFLGALLTPDINNGDMIATELFWYVDPKNRTTLGSIRLLDAFEHWAREMDVKRIIMAHLIGQPNQSGERIGKFYEKRGFKSVEVHYVKIL